MHDQRRTKEILKNIIDRWENSVTVYSAPRSISRTRSQNSASAEPHTSGATISNSDRYQAQRFQLEAASFSGQQPKTYEDRLQGGKSKIIYCMFNDSNMEKGGKVMAAVFKERRMKSKFRQMCVQFARICADWSFSRTLPAPCVKRRSCW